MESLLSDGDPNALFELIEELAVGSYGTVYKAIHGPSGDTVALKIIKIEEDDTLEAMVDEVRIMKLCTHPNIVKFYGAWKTQDELFIAMELCGGGSVLDLYQVLKKPLSEAQISLIARDTLSALEYMHDSLNIIHRDIKAANLLLTDEGKLKLTDFGVSAIRKTRSERRTSIIGTPYWMAPEVCRGSFYDEKCDIWSVGVVCLELSELIWPLSELPAMQALVELMQGYVPRLKEPQKWSSNFVSFVNECLEPDPAKRKRATDLLRSSPAPQVEPDKVKQEIKREIEAARQVEESYSKTATPPATEEEDEPPNAIAAAIPKLTISAAQATQIGTPPKRTTRKPKTLITLKRGNLPDNVEIKRLVKNQLRLLKKLQQRHHLEREDLNRVHLLRMQKLEAKSASDFLALTEEQKAEFKRLKDKQEADLVEQKTRNDAEIQALRAAQEEDLKKKAVQLSTLTKKQVQALPKGADPIEHESGLQMEERRSLAQYAVEQLQALHKLQRELEKKVLQLKISNSLAFPAVLHRQNDEVYSAQIHYLETEYAEKSQQQQEMQKLLVSQANAEHKFLSDQQGEQLAMEHKFKVKEWKAKQKEELKQIDLVRKDPNRDKKEAARLADERKKELDRHDDQFVKSLKTQQEEMKRTLDQRLNERLSNFKQRATKEKAETAKVFLAKYKTLKEEHRSQQQVYIENRQKNLEEIFADQKQRDEAAIEKQWAESRTLLENKFKDELRLLQEQLKQRNQSEEQFGALLDSLQLSHDTAMNELLQQKQFLQSQAADYLSRMKGDALSKDKTEAAKAIKKGNKDKKDRQAQGFKENLKRLLLPTSAAEIEEYKKAMRQAYEAQQQQKEQQKEAQKTTLSPPSAPLIANRSEDLSSVSSTGSHGGNEKVAYDLTQSMSAPLDSANLSRSFKPEPPSEPRPDRRSKTYTPEQVQDSTTREAQKEVKETKEVKEVKEKERDKRHSNRGSNRGEEPLERERAHIDKRDSRTKLVDSRGERDSRDGGRERDSKEKTDSAKEKEKEKDKESTRKPKYSTPEKRSSNSGESNITDSGHKRTGSSSGAASKGVRK